MVGKYKTGERVGWMGGDWNGDEFFDQKDITLSMKLGNYHTPSQAALIPEPCSALLLILGVMLLAHYKRILNNN
jgi:hypothetical protein